MGAHIHPITPRAGTAIAILRHVWEPREGFVGRVGQYPAGWDLGLGTMTEGARAFRWRHRLAGGIGGWQGTFALVAAVLIDARGRSDVGAPGPGAGRPPWRWRMGRGRRRVRVDLVPRQRRAAAGNRSGRLFRLHRRDRAHSEWGLPRLLARHRRGRHVRSPISEPFATRRVLLPGLRARGPAIPAEHGLDGRAVRAADAGWPSPHWRESSGLGRAGGKRLASGNRSPDAPTRAG